MAGCTCRVRPARCFSTNPRDQESRAEKFGDFPSSRGNSPLKNDITLASNLQISRFRLCSLAAMMALCLMPLLLDAPRAWSSSTWKYLERQVNCLRHDPACPDYKLPGAIRPHASATSFATGGRAYRGSSQGRADLQSAALTTELYTHFVQ